LREETSVQIYVMLLQCVLQYVAVCCSVSAVCRNVLQCVAACKDIVLQCVAVFYSLLQSVAMRHNVLQCVAVCYSVLQLAKNFGTGQTGFLECFIMCE